MHLSIDDDSHPVALAGPWNRQHCPEKDGNGKDQRNTRGWHQVVYDDDQVAHQLWVSHQHVVEGVAKLEEQRLVLVEFIWLLQLLVIKHPGQTEEALMEVVTVKNYLCLIFFLKDRNYITTEWL